MSGATVEPVFVDVSNKVSVDAPLSLYLALRDRRYPYLLESVEKSGQKARFSFVGADPSAMISVKNRFLRMEFYNGGMGPIEERLSGCVDVEKIGSVLQGPIKEGYDLFDVLRASHTLQPGHAQQLRQTGVHRRGHRLPGLRSGQGAPGQKIDR